MGLVIALGTYGGYYLDVDAGRWSNDQTPWATVVSSLLSTLLALGLVVKQILNDAK